MNDQLNRFRLASRELFNGYFRIPNPYENDGWRFEELFSRVQDILFESLVIAQTGASAVPYGQVNSSIVVLPTSSVRIPLMISRGPNTGAWDHPVTIAPPEARFHFCRFFDWDQLDYRDNRYVRVVITQWPEKEELIGKEALIESQYVRYEKNA